MIVRTITCFAALFLFSSCATVSEIPDVSDRRYAEVISSYPQTEEVLQVPRLTYSSLLALSPAVQSQDVFVIVHPGYSFFFNNGMKKQYYRGAKFRMQELQFSLEARFIAEQAHAGSIIVLVVPGNYPEDSIAPRSYTAYLNTTAQAGASVFYVPSITSSNGNLSGSDLVVLYQLLQSVKARKVLLGGGYVGRCQREFYDQLTSFYDQALTYVIREVSTISPEDVSEREASRIVAGIEQADFSAISRFLAKKLDDDTNIISIPQQRDR